MGIKGLTKLLADNAPKSMKEQKFESYFGRKVAIDASMSIYQFLIVVGRIGTETLTNEAGEVTSHLQGMFTRTIRLLESGLKPVYVFDGKPPDLKKQELAKRYTKRADATEDLNVALETGNKEEIEKFSKRTVKVTKQHNDDCKRLLKLMGVPVIEVYAVASEDMDSLTFGAPRFLRHLMDPSSKKVPVMEFEVSKVLEELNLTMDQFIDLCILCGCDYCDSIRGEFGACNCSSGARETGDGSGGGASSLGTAGKVRSNKITDDKLLTGNRPKCSLVIYRISHHDNGKAMKSIGGQTALKLIRQHGSIENILENINKERYQIPDDWPYQEARHLFKEPLVFVDDEQLDIKWSAPDEEGLINFLVTENGFNSDRITKAIEKIKAAKNKSTQGRYEMLKK
ncbi:hypothetical protein TEA_015352 [Camellia sinensis var. sinensis]|uniref:Flap endonuclease 1 n=1 Tax=Camellia sinensis var. sinensis TaxID=542762 RepID=A0A4S4F397_CAMSN|nr:hypothetical protein TEA_015352 [Camellia sinensis var. sinensis]